MSGAGEELCMVIFVKQKKKEKEKKRWSEIVLWVSSDRSGDRSALSCSQKMRGLNPDRNPCVQCSIRSLGFNFTDWFAPFFSVRILTRKVASAEPLYYQAFLLERYFHKGINAKSEILMRKRKVEGRGRGKERKRMRKKERKRKGKREREIGSEALAETEKIANAPAGNRTRDPSKRGWCSTIKPPRQATSPASLFEILSVLPPLHNIGIIQCPQTKPASLGEPVTVAIVHRARPERIVIKGINAKSEILMRKRKVEGRGRGKERKRMRKKERKRKGKREREIGSEALAETEKIANAP